MKLNKFAYLQGGYAFKSNSFQKNGNPIIRIANITNNKIDFNDIVYYDNNIHIDSKFAINNNDLLIAMSGATTGKFGIYTKKQSSYLNQRVGKLVLKNYNLIYSYLYYLFELDTYNIQLSNKLVTGAQPNISPSDIENIKFKFPNLEIQQKISEITNFINRKIEIEEKKYNNLVKYKNYLLQKMFI